MKLLLIKIGTKILTTPNNELDLNNMRRLCDQISEIEHSGAYKCLLVSSGSIVAGSQLLRISPKTLPEKQAAASVGQPLLLKEYSHFFSDNAISVGQILLTKDIVLDPEKKQHAYNTITTLLSHSIIPIINENDSVATDEIQFGDNDILASIVAKMMSVQLVAILTDTDGIYTKNPHQYRDATHIPSLTSISNRMIEDATDAEDSRGRGGLKSKLMCAKHCLDDNIETVITHGRHTSLSLAHILATQCAGTWFKKT